MPKHPGDLVFISYHDEDRSWLERLVIHLAPLLQKIGRRCWSDTDVKAGAEWKAETDLALSRACVLVLLVSADYLAAKEIECMLEAARLHHATLLWLPVRSSAYEETKLVGVVPLLDPTRALALLKREEAEFELVQISKRIAQAANGIGVDVLMPAYRNEPARALGEQLQRLYEQKEQQILSGENPSAIVQSILEIRRQLRQGPQLQAGEYLQDGRFRLVRHIGKGGFATVWLAYDRVIQQQVAIKVLHAQWADDTQRLERFYRGARRMAQLHHPGIVRITEQPQEEHGFHFFVMDYVSGGDLRSSVQSHLLSPTQGLDIIKQVGQALQYAHRCGIIHRDVKPANILLGTDGPGLTDFDLAWAVDTTGGTNTGALGTFLYAAPEMMQDAKDVTPAVDVYSLAMTTAFVLFGTEPAEIVGDRLGFLNGFIRSPKLLAALCKATERDPKKRFSSVMEFCTALSDPLLLMTNNDVARFSAQDHSLRLGLSEDTVEPGSFADIKRGFTIGGYRIIRLLGSGGMGDVYEAHHTHIGKRAAVKFLRPDVSSRNPTLAQRFLNEARAVHQVEHAGLVDIFDFGQISDGTLFLIMEYLKGENLRQRIDRRGGRLTWQEAVRLVSLIASPMEAAHQVGVIHRDLKPANIMLISDSQLPHGERVKILDFGVAVLADSRHLESDGVLIGTPDYMSPEQVLANGDIDGKADVYSLGCILTEMITGHLPYESAKVRTIDLLMNKIKSDPDNILSLGSEIPWELADIVRRMLAKQPTMRPTMAAVAQRFGQFRDSGV